MAITATGQRNAASEGTALGLLMCKREALQYDKVRIDLAFSGAWRGWPHKGTFPQVSTDISKGLDGAHALFRVDESKRTFGLYWADSDGQTVIRLRQSWVGVDLDFDELAADIDDGVSALDWRELAIDFLVRYDRQAS